LFRRKQAYQLENVGNVEICNEKFMHQSIPAVPIPPPGPTPGIRIFLKKMANSRGWGQVSTSNAPEWDQNRRQMPHPRDHLESNTAQDFNNKS